MVQTPWVGDKYGVEKTCKPFEGNAGIGYGSGKYLLWIYN
jgi:hypothetical protein